MTHQQTREAFVLSLRGRILSCTETFFVVFFVVITAEFLIARYYTSMENLKPISLLQILVSPRSYIAPAIIAFIALLNDRFKPGSLLLWKIIPLDITEEENYFKFKSNEIAQAMEHEKRTRSHYEQETTASMERSAALQKELDELKRQWL